MKNYWGRGSLGFPNPIWECHQLSCLYMQKHSFNSYIQMFIHTNVNHGFWSHGGTLWMCVPPPQVHWFQLRDLAFCQARVSHGMPRCCEPTTPMKGGPDSNPLVCMRGCFVSHWPEVQQVEFNGSGSGAGAMKKVSGIISKTGNSGLMLVNNPG